MTDTPITLAELVSMERSLAMAPLSVEDQRRLIEAVKTAMVERCPKPAMTGHRVVTENPP